MLYSFCRTSDCSGSCLYTHSADSVASVNSGSDCLNLFAKTTDKLYQDGIQFAKDRTNCIVFFPISQKDKLVLPCEVRRLILFEFLEVRDIVRFDTALCNEVMREQWISSLLNYKSPIFDNFIYPSLGSLRWVIRKKINLNDFTVCREKLDGHETLLHWGCRTKMISVVKLLVTKSTIDVDVRCNRGDTALYVAVDNSHIELVKLLKESRNANVNIANGSGWTPLMRAAIHGNRDILQLLLSYNANPHARNYNTDTPLHIACEYNQLDIVRDLLEADEGKNKTTTIARNMKGELPIHKAARGANGARQKDAKERLQVLEIMKIFIQQYKIDPSLTDNQGNNVLHNAIRGNCVEAVEFILESTKNNLELLRVEDLINKKNELAKIK